MDDLEGNLITGPDALDKFLHGGEDFLDGGEDLEGTFTEPQESSHDPTALLDDLLQVGGGLVVKPLEDEQEYPVDDLEEEEKEVEWAEGEFIAQDSDQIRENALNGGSDNKSNLPKRRWTWSWKPNATNVQRTAEVRSKSISSSQPTTTTTTTTLFQNGKENVVQSFVREFTTSDSSDSLDKLADKLRQELFFDVDIDSQSQTQKRVSWSPQEEHNSESRSEAGVLHQEPISPLLSTKRFFARALNLDQRIEDIAVKLAKLCFDTRPENDGFLSVAEAHRILNETETEPVEPEDIIYAVERLAELDSDYAIIKLGNSDMIKSS